jgi:hypothetical protein
MTSPTPTWPAGLRRRAARPLPSHRLEHAKAIAQAYDKLPMFDPAALPSYDALINETLAQYQQSRTRP